MVSLTKPALPKDWFGFQDRTQRCLVFTQERTGHERRFRSSDPTGSTRRGRVIETNGKQSEIITRRAFDEASGGSRRKETETLLVREVEELKGRAVQMEKTMRSAKKTII